MKDQSEIKDRINDLRRKIPENGATEDEAMAALAMAARLMEKHGITEEDLETTDAVKDMRQGKHEYGIKTQHPCSKFCGGRIAQFCGVRSWHNRYFNTSNAFGYNGDVEMYEFLINLVHRSMDREWKTYLANNPKRPGVSRHTEYWSHMMGMADRINTKIREMMAEREQTTGTDLIVKKEAIVEAGMAEVMPDLRIKQSRSRGMNVDPNALIQGLEAGERVNLQRPIQEGPKVARKRLT
jgi:putative ubiquitin-RnfH superfamily antitoxin RatB of RatAB toxin-antitoxin module